MVNLIRLRSGDSTAGGFSAGRVTLTFATRLPRQTDRGAEGPQP
jgi:hypothetical protein